MSAHTSSPDPAFPPPRAPEGPVTLEEFCAMPEEDLYLLELVRGMVVREPRPASLHGAVLAELTYLLQSHVRTTKQGVVLTDAGFRLEGDPPTVRGPDIAFVARERVPPAGYAETFWRIGPDLAVEILSSNTLSDMQEKVLDFFNAGTRMVWIVDPRKRTVMVYRSLDDIRLLHGAAELDGMDVLAGFRVRLPDLFTF